MQLTDAEREVIHAMRASDRAQQAIYRYATNFSGDDQAIGSAEWTDEYERSYE